MRLDQGGRIIAEYVWIDAFGETRSKSRVSSNCIPPSQVELCNLHTYGESYRLSAKESTHPIIFQFGILMVLQLSKLQSTTPTYICAPVLYSLTLSAYHQTSLFWQNVGMPMEHLTSSIFVTIARRSWADMQNTSHGSDLSKNTLSLVTMGDLSGGQLEDFRHRELH